MKNFTTSKKLIYTILIVLALAIMLVVIVKTVSAPQKHTRDNSEGETFSEKLYLSYNSDNLVCLRSKLNGKKVSAYFEKIYFAEDEDSITVFVSNEKRGYLNANTGAIVIPAVTFSYAWQFDPETKLAAVVQNGLLGFIDRSGKWRVNPQFSYNHLLYRDVAFNFSDGTCIIPDSSGKYGLIDQNGKILLKPVYDYIYNMEYGYRVVEKNGMAGLVDSVYQFIINPDYDNISVNDKGILVTKGQTQQLLSYDLKKVISGKVFDSLYKLLLTDIESTEEGEVRTSMETGYSVYSINGKYGLIRDETGKVLTQPEWDEIDFHSPGVFKVTLGGEYYLINSKGNIIN